MNIYEVIKKRTTDKSYIKYRRDDEEYKINYFEFFEIVDRLVTSLIKIGIKKGDKIGIHLPTCIEWMAIDFACLKIGAISIPINNKLPEVSIKKFLDSVHLDLLFSVL